MRDKVVTIHQPDFMPWLGFFVKIWRADVFVVLDHVEMDPGSASWHRRVRMCINGNPDWVNVPVVKSKRGRAIPINTMTIKVDENKMMEKALRQIQASYRLANYFNEFYPLIECYYKSDEVNLAKRNMVLIKDLLEILNIKTEIIYSSNLPLTSVGNQMNCDITRLVEGNVYLSGDGAAEYQLEKAFLESGIQLRLNNFSPKEYSQVNVSEFMPGLSIVDLLLNCGARDAKKLIESYGVII